MSCPFGGVEQVPTILHVIHSNVVSGIMPSNDLVLTNRFRYQRGNIGSSMTYTSRLPIIPNRPPRGGTNSFRSNVFRTVSFRTIRRTAYIAPSSKSIFKYRSKSWIANKSKSKSPSKALTSKNPFVFHKSVRKSVITPIHPYRLSVKRAIIMNRRFVRQICPDYVKTGSCESADNCPLRHDSSYLRICPKFVFSIGRNLLCACKKRHIWRGEFDLNKNEKSKSVPQSVTTNEDIVKESEQLGSLRNAKVVPDFIPFHVSDD
ncbi:hypothetical protein ACTXT7_000239 [Hymenolepis weldensis]